MQLKPTADEPTVAGYQTLHQITYPPMRPNQIGNPTGIPVNTLGWIGHRLFSKTQQVVPVKNVIKIQMNSL